VQVRTSNLVNKYFDRPANVANTSAIPTLNTTSVASNVNITEITTEGQDKVTVAPSERPENKSKEVSQSVEADIDAEIMVEAAEDADVEAESKVEVEDNNNKAERVNEQNTAAAVVTENKAAEPRKLEDTEAGIGSDLFETTVTQLDAMLKLMSGVGTEKEDNLKEASENFEAKTTEDKRDDKIQEANDSVEVNSADKTREDNNAKSNNSAETNSGKESNKEVIKTVEVSAVGDNHDEAKEKEPFIEVISL
jgi:hypothetical protein